MTELKKPEPTIVDRVNAAAAKVSDVLMEARNAARDELLWLAAQYRELLTERDQLAAALEAAREDAERYRWLKQHAFCGVWHRGDGLALVAPRVIQREVDAAIDRARKGEQ